MLNDGFLTRKLNVIWSGEASLTIWSCYANISVFIKRENIQFLNNNDDLKA
jgi:hypothetical protein